MGPKLLVAQQARLLIGLDQMALQPHSSWKNTLCSFSMRVTISFIKLNLMFNLLVLQQYLRFLVHVVTTYLRKVFLDSTTDLPTK